MNIYLESVLRLIAVFLSVFFTYRWTYNSKPGYDLVANCIVILLALVMNHIGPLKIQD